MLDCEVLAIIEEFAKTFVAASGKPSYSFGLAGSAPASSWLDADGKPSNKTGIPFGLNNGRLTEIWVGSEKLSTYDLSVYYHYGDETGLTLLKTVSIPNTVRTKTFKESDIGVVSVPKDCQIAVQISSVTGTPQPTNTGCHLTIKGTAA